MILKMPVSESLKRFSQKLKKIILLFFLICLFFIALILIFSFFTITDIQVSGISNLKGLTDLKQKVIFLIDEKKVASDLYRINPRLGSVKITKRYPNKIIINGVENKTVAALKTADAFFHLSSTGRLLAKEREPKKNYPIIYYYQKFSYDAYNVGENFKLTDIQYALFFIDKFRDLGIKTQSLDIAGVDMLILKSDDRTFFLTTQRSSKDQYEDLKIINKRFTIEGVKFKSIDLRFDKPIIKLK